MNSSDSERFETLYRRLWGALNHQDDADLSQHERQVLHHLLPHRHVPLTWLAEHLGQPKSTMSVMIKDLAARGFVQRERDPGDERRLAITLTEHGRQRVERDTVLRPDDLAAALAKLDPDTTAALLTGMTRLADAAEELGG
jgi:DNA-binding MarR family transcriptional regulator